MAYENLIRWYKASGYDFDDIADEVMSNDIIKKEITTLKDFADEKSAVSKKPFSKGQKEGLRLALESDVIQGEFERNLHKREEQEQIRAEQYTSEVKRIKGLQQITRVEEFESKYKDIEESIEIQNAKKVRSMVKKEITSRMAEAREAEKLKQYRGAEDYIRGLTRERVDRRTPRAVLKFKIPSKMWSTREGTWEGKTYGEYETIATEVMQREGVIDSTGRYIPLDERKEV